MTENYYNFGGTTIDTSEVASRITTELRKNEPKTVESPTPDKFTVRTVARVVDSAFSEFLEDVEYRLTVALGVDIDLDLSRFESAFEDVCDTVESEVARNEEEAEDEDDLLGDIYGYAWDRELSDELEEEDEYYVDSEEYDYENPRY